MRFKDNDFKIKIKVHRRFESSETVSTESKNQSKTDCHVVEKQCGNMENPKVIAPGMFKLNVLQCVSPISMSKLSCDSNNVEIKLKRKRQKIIIDLEDEVVSLLEKEKANLETIETLKSKGFESSEKVSSESKNQTENDCLVVEKECDKEENPKVIAHGMFKLNVSQCVSLISMSKSSCGSKNVENSDTFSIVRRPKNNGVIWKKKGSSNTSNVGLSAVSVSNLNKKCYAIFSQRLVGM
nr:hypothetical protein [Tanacetum cinerariifolium]